MAEHDFAIELLDLDGIVPNEKNPQRGDIGAIMTAIAVDGWHGAVLCEKRRGKPRIFAGEHRWRGLAALNADGFTFSDGSHKSYEELLATPKLLLPPAGKVPVQTLSVDEIRAARKLVADNRASSLAETDDHRLAAMLREFAEEDGLLGSLFDGDDLDYLISSLDDDFGSGNIREVNTPGDRLADYLDSAIRSLILPYPSAQYEEVIRALDEAQVARGCESHSETVALLLREASVSEAATD